MFTVFLESFKFKIIVWDQIEDSDNYRKFTFEYVFSVIM